MCWSSNEIELLSSYIVSFSGRHKVYHRHVVNKAITLMLWRGCAETCAPWSRHISLVQTLHVDQNFESTESLYQRGAPCELLCAEARRETSRLLSGWDKLIIWHCVANLHSQNTSPHIKFWLCQGIKLGIGTQQLDFLDNCQCKLNFWVVCTLKQAKPGLTNSAVPTMSMPHMKVCQWQYK